MARKTAGRLSDADALLAAVWADPHGDTPRLVYADWLEESGDAERAEFIRLQVERARVEALGGAVPDAALRREAELWAAHRPEWWAGGGPDGGYALAAGFCVRGFPAPVLKLTASAAARSAAPAARVRAGWTRPDGLAVLLRSRPVRGCGELTLAPLRRWSAADFAALAGADRPDYLSALCLEGCTAAGAGAESWLAGLALARLHRLGLPEGCAGGIAALAGSPVAPRLTELDLGWADSDAADLRDLGESSAFARLRTLRPGWRSTTDAGLAEFVTSPGARGLRELNLANCPAAGAEFCRAVAADPPPGLRVLRLGRFSAPSAAAARSLAESPGLTGGLRELYAHVRRGTGPYRELRAAFGDRLRPN